MTLLDRIEHFISAAHPEDDLRTAEDHINYMTPYQLLAEISDALEHAGVTFNTEF